MTISHDPSNPAAPSDEQLVAYLDGELDLEGSRRIEELLASNADVRRRVQEMERTWDLLDDLDSPPVEGRFVQSTLEMVALAAHDDVERSLAEAPRLRRRRAMAIGAGLLGALAAGFLAVILLWPDPNRQLLQDLSLLENLDQYRQVGDIEFLRMLRDQGLFLKGNDAASGIGAAQDESLDRRRQRILSMSPSQQEQLVRLQERFADLDPDQQRQLHRLDQAIQEASDAMQLRQVMRRYYEWLRAFPSYTRAEWAEMKPADRIKAVKKRLDEQLREERQHLSDKDVESLRKWIGDCAMRYEAQFMKTMSDKQRKKLSELAAPDRYRWIFWQMWQTAGPGKPPPLMTDDDLTRLRADLSPELRKRLESLPTAKQWQQVAGWLRHMMRQRAAARVSHGPMPKADGQRLAQFFEHELSDNERDRLLRLPGEEMQRELWRLYLMRTEGPARRSEGQRYDKRPGGEWPTPKKPEENIQTPSTR